MSEEQLIGTIRKQVKARIKGADFYPWFCHQQVGLLEMRHFPFNFQESILIGLICIVVFAGLGKTLWCGSFRLLLALWFALCCVSALSKLLAVVRSGSVFYK